MCAIWHASLSLARRSFRLALDPCFLFELNSYVYLFLDTSLNGFSCLFKIRSWPINQHSIRFPAWVLCVLCVLVLCVCVWLSSKLICPFLRGVKQIERETDSGTEIETEDPTGNSRLCKFNRKGRPGFPVRQLNNRIALKEKPKPKPKNQPKESQSKSRKTCFPQPNSGYCWVIMVFFFCLAF